MGNYFTHDEVFPIIARIITKRYSETGTYVPHWELALALLHDTDAGVILDRAEARGSRQGRRVLASTMIAWFSQQITMGRNEWAPYFDRTRSAGKYAYRPATAAPTLAGDDVDLSAIEGEPRLISHLRRERDRGLVTAKKRHAIAATGRLKCEACGFDFRDRYPGIAEDYCEVHHNRPLSEAGGGVATRLDDLAILCSNCHRMIHRTRPIASVSEFKRLLRTVD